MACSKRDSVVNVLMPVDPKPEGSVVRVGRVLVQIGVVCSIFSRISCATQSPMYMWKGVTSLRAFFVSFLILCGFQFLPSIPVLLLVHVLNPSPSAMYAPLVDILSNVLGIPFLFSHSCAYAR
jgi:hypothetical protein